MSIRALTTYRLKCDWCDYSCLCQGLDAVEATIAKFKWEVVEVGPDAEGLPAMGHKHKCPNCQRQHAAAQAKAKNG